MSNRRHNRLVYPQRYLGKSEMAGRRIASTRTLFDSYLFQVGCCIDRWSISWSNSWNPSDRRAQPWIVARSTTAGLDEWTESMWRQTWNCLKMGLTNSTRFWARTNPRRTATGRMMDAVSQARVIFGILLYHCPRSFDVDMMDNKAVEFYPLSLEWEVSRKWCRSLNSLVCCNRWGACACKRSNGNGKTRQLTHRFVIAMQTIHERTCQSVHGNNLVNLQFISRRVNFSMRLREVFGAKERFAFVKRHLYVKGFYPVLEGPVRRHRSTHIRRWILT